MLLLYFVVGDEFGGVMRLVELSYSIHLENPQWKVMQTRGSHRI